MKKSIFKNLFLLFPLLLGGCAGVEEKPIADKSYIYGMTDLSGQENGVDYHYTHKLFEAMGVKSVRIWMHCNWIMKNPTEYSTSGLEKMRAIYDDLKAGGYQIIAMNHMNFHKTGMINSASYTAKPHRDLEEGSYYLQWLSDLETTYYNMVKAFPDIEYWEIDNECNNDDFMPALGGVNFDLEEKAQVYYDMMYFASRGIHRANPNAKTVMGGLIVSNAQTFLETIYDYIDGKNSWSSNPDDYFQVACWHPYMPNYTREQFVTLNNKIYNVIKTREGKDKKVFFTEVGFSENGGVKLSDQEKYIKDMYDACKNDLPYVESVHYFRMYDEYASTWGSDAEKTFGLFYDPVSEKVTEGEKVSLAQPKVTAKVYQECAGGTGDLNIYKDFLQGNYTTKIVMHRGYNSLARENTVKAFTLAGEQPDVHGIETDVWLTKDNKPIIIHDGDTKRVTLGKYNLNVKNSTFNELRSIRLPDENGNPDVEQIPSLTEYCEVLKKYNKVGFVELKEDFSSESLDIILNEIKNSGISMDKIVFISFYKNAILRLLEKDSQYKTMILYNEVGSLTDQDYEEHKQKNIGIDVEFSSLSDEQIQKIQRLGIKLNIWTVNSKDIANKYGRMSVDYITTDCLPSFKG
ncbi:MAG: hypothetical protein MJ221_03505 [Bacilli bacterium]|nr:hypothetical protein [Bacilli bacterium]